MKTINSTTQGGARLSGPARLASPARQKTDLPPNEILPEQPAAAGRREQGSSTALTLYLREVGQAALLTRPEEMALARRVQSGDEAARERLIRANLRLVVKIARDFEDRLREILRRNPDDAELARELGLSVRRVGELRAVPCAASLDAPLGQEDSATLGDVVADENAPNPCQLFEERNFLSRLREAIARLPERESRIIRSRFGLGDGREKTLDEVAAEFRLTRERIRQLQNMVLHKLRRMLEQAVAPLSDRAAIPKSYNLGAIAAS